MSVLYPKQPFGPSAPGSAGVRALDIADSGAYQRKWTDTNTQALRQGDFRKVITDGFEYVSTGRVSPTKISTQVAKLYQVPFLPFANLGSGINIEGGQYVNARELGNSFASEPNFSYTIYGAVQQAYSTSRFSIPIDNYLESFYGAGRFLFSVTISFSVPSGTIGTIPATANLAYLGRVPGDKIAAFPTLADVGRTDSAGRGLGDIVLYLIRVNGAPSTVVFNAGAFTRTNAEFSPSIGIVAFDGFVALLAAEFFFFPGEYTAPANYQTKWWLFVAPIDNFAAASVYDVTGVMFPSTFVPAPVAASGPIPAHYNTASGSPANRSRTLTLLLMRSVALPGGQALLFYPQYCNPPGGPAAWHSRVSRISINALAVNAVLLRDVPGTASGPLPSELSQYVQSVVHLGAGYVLAKIVKGFNGIDFDVQFSLSTDSGATWSDFNPSGFGAPLKNQFFGDFIVHRARTASTPGVVLVSSWDAAAQAYFIYASNDDGLTWARRGRIATPTTFYRIDAMAAGDGGGNFALIRPGPNLLRPADITLPDRYIQ